MTVAAVALAGLSGLLIGLGIGYGLGWTARAEWVREPFEGLRPDKAER